MVDEGSVFVTRQKVAILNIEDAEAYVRAQLPRVLMSPETREDIVQTGLMLLSEMRGKYQPGIGGQDPSTSTFSGYVEGQHLGDKLRDHWHRMEGHRLTSDGEGGRKWTYPPARSSLDQIQEREGGLDSVRSLHTGDVYDTDLGLKIARASDEQHAADKELEVQVGVMLGEGIAHSEVAKRLGLRDKEVTETVQRIIRLTPRMTTMEAVAA